MPDPFSPDELEAIGLGLINLALVSRRVIIIQTEHGWQVEAFGAPVGTVKDRVRKSSVSLADALELANNQCRSWRVRAKAREKPRAWS